MNFIDSSKFENYLFRWNKKEQNGGDIIKMNDDEEVQVMNGGAGFPLISFGILNKHHEKHNSRFKDLVVPMGLVLEK